ncbi:TetR/AcrR family transcriptional regulator [Cytophagales bacterium LB-30]|uniref:TetR/AcrR family transcriptional regulator n=1 Tax=Shiella aurantiaca TaxID=3058365 RepID=A0ABT8F7K7_9BACT|nr:TetR/AcrR family transcriptional regulator [Shiella aurantiaca]MDN4166467.1 TetR/AcrR family transcriptional regulator [Shiella aurantiaca]
MDTRSQILQIAERLIKTKGYTAFSYHDIAQELGVKNAAIHYHFTNKELLGIAVVERAIQQWDAYRTRLSKEPVLIQLLEFINLYKANQQERQVCLIGAIATQVTGLPPTMGMRLQVLAESIHTYLSHVLEEGKQKEIFSFETSPSQKAFLIISNLAAGLQLARVMGPQVFQEIKSGILKELSVYNYE